MANIQKIKEQYDEFANQCKVLCSYIEDCLEKNKNIPANQPINILILRGCTQESVLQDIQDRFVKLCNEYRLLLTIPLLQEYQYTLEKMDSIHPLATIQRLIDSTLDRTDCIGVLESAPSNEFAKLRHHSMYIEQLLLDAGLEKTWLMNNGYQMQIGKKQKDCFRICANDKNYMASLNKLFKTVGDYSQAISTYLRVIPQEELLSHERLNTLFRALFYNKLLPSSSSSAFDVSQDVYRIVLKDCVDPELALRL